LVVGRREGGGRGGVLGNWGWGCVGGGKKEGERLPSGSQHVLVGVWEKNEGGWMREEGILIVKTTYSVSKEDT
jgi:hypothetical protein